MAQRASLNALDRLVSLFSPQAGVNRLRARMVLAHYEAARPNPQRKFRRDASSADVLVGKGAVPMRNQIRYLARNHDLVVGAVRVLVNNIVGPCGISIEPQPQRADGSIHTEYAAALKEAWRDWQARPEVTWQHDWAQCQRLMAATWVRDGEAFSQRLIGPVTYLDHGTRVPYSLELMEPDLVPMDYNDGDRIRQGIERNSWGRPIAAWVYKSHPGDATTLAALSNLKRIPFERMLHVKHVDRIHQLRGVSMFASVITRIEDLKDYEESERIAAKVAAMLTAYVKRQAPQDVGYEKQVDDAGNPVNREIGMAPGMIIDTLAAGEEIGLIDSKRPNPNLVMWRDGQLRAFAAGVGASYSSISRNYNGTFSAQRQELVEQWVNYAALTDIFVGQCARPVYNDFVMAADLSRVVPIPPDVKPGTENDCLYTAPSMPWIDPVKEITAWVMAVQAGFASEYEVIRSRGNNPHDLLRQVKAWRDEAAKQGLVFNSNAANSGNQPAGAQQSAAADPSTDPAASTSTAGDTNA